MQNFFNLLKNLFSKKEVLPTPPGKTYPLGAVPNEPDNRDIPYAAVSLGAPTTAPVITVTGFFEAERLEQGALGTCVPHALEFIDRLFDKIKHSRRVLYVLTRNAIGWGEAQGQGLPQREAAKMMTIVGTTKDAGLDDNTLSHKDYTSLPITQAMKDEANLYRFGGFAFPHISVAGIKQTLADNKPVAITIPIDWNKIEADGTVRLPSYIYGNHEVTIGQSDDTIQKFRFANWWGKPWGTNCDGFIRYDEVEALIRDAIVATDIPNDLKERAKNMQYIFNSDLKFGTISEGVGQLQKRLIAYGVYTGAIDKQYGPKTRQAVSDYQRFKGLVPDGQVGPATRQAVNKDAGNALKGKLDLWIEAVKVMEGAKPSRNNPGNLRYVGQQYAVNDNGFCKFDTYQHGYDALRSLLVHACSGLSSVYDPNGSLYKFYQTYAPASDGNNPKHYAEFVAGHIGVDPNAPIKALLI